MKVVYKVLPSPAPSSHPLGRWQDMEKAEKDLSPCSTIAEERAAGAEQNSISSRGEFFSDKCASIHRILES